MITVATLGIALVLTALLCKWLPMWRLPLEASALAALCVLLGFIFVPVNGLTLAQLLQGGTGEFSFASCAVAGILLYERVTGQGIISVEQRRLFYICVLATGCLLYPMALGLSYFDSYSLGFQPLLLAMAA